MNGGLALFVALPLAGTALCFVLAASRRTQRAVALLCSAAVTAGAAVLLVHVDRHGPVTTSMGGWPDAISITFVADRLGALMLVVGNLMMLAVLVYALAQGASDERSPWYAPAYLALIAGVSGAFLAGDLFNLFVCFEILLMASYVLLTLEGTDDQIRSGTTYVVLNVVESLVLVTGVALVYATTGTLSMAELPERLDALPDGVALGLSLLLLVAFGLKAAVFPLFSWLPDSYPAAPSPVSAVFAGLLTKVGVYAILRMQTQWFPGTNRTLLLVVAGATMVVGVLGAIAQSDIKRILSFHIVSQIGYMIAGIALGGVAAVAAVVYYVVHHIPVKTSLFLVDGVVEQDTGTSALDRLSGLARRSGALAALFLVPALSLAGLPPFSGFVGKLGIVSVGLDQGQWWIVGVALVVSILTLVSMMKIWTGAFWGPAPAEDRPGVLRHHPLMSGVTTFVVVLTLVVALFAGPIFRFAERTAADLVATTAPTRPQEAP
ncbi:MAG: proton-conducting transporter membrane subunit [Actinomycetes bacterium]